VGVGLRLATFQLGSLVVSTFVIPLFSCASVEHIFLKLGLTLGRVVMVEVTRKVNTSYRIQQFQANLMTESQMGAVNAIYSYTLVAIL
jgi:hypothetical protein